MNRTIVEMDNIVKSFAGIKALNDVHLDLREGELHALMGENGAGKSTLMKILTGVYSKDSGTIKLASEDGSLKEVEIKTPLQAQHLGSSMVFQEFNLLDNMDIAENIFLGREPVDRKHCIDKKKMYANEKKWLDKVHLDIDPKSKVSDLSVGFKQLLEIAKCLSFNARIIILDEPTASLTDRESETLFSIIDELKRNNISIVYISHRMEEVFNLADRITVFRDGTYIDTVERKNFKEDEIIKMMIGRELQEDVSARTIKGGSDEIALEVQNIKVYKNSTPVNLKLRKGEILGIAGLAGAGKTELCKALFGASKSRVQRGELNGQPWRPRDPADSVGRGLALVPEERRKEGIFIEEPIAMNLAVSADNSFSRWSLFGHRQAWRWAEEVIARLGVRATGPGQTLRRLSGGNQQKVAIGKWLRGDANVLIFDEPTKGVDVKAKTDLFMLIDGLAREGKGVIYASGEFAELVGLCDRICVLWDGRIVAEIPGAEAREETLLYYSTGGAAA